MTTDVVVMSGGLDSTTLLYHVNNTIIAEDIKAISFDYGQRHKKELEYAVSSCDALGIEHDIIDITSITSYLAAGGSSLVDDSTLVPEGHYGEASMAATVVPNRNMIMSSIAAGHAVALGASSLWMGVHAGDHFIYPDCRPRFFTALNAAITLGNMGFGAIPELDEGAYFDFVQTPFINWSKADIAEIAIRLGLPLHETWSCYVGGENHCGRCGTCVERIEAIEEAIGRFDNEYVDCTIYEDPDFWREAIKRETV